MWRRTATLALLLLPACREGSPLPAHPATLTDAEVIETLRNRQARVGSVVAEGRGSLSGSPDSDGSFRWQCWAQGTSRLRLTLSHRLKGCLADLVIEGDRAQCLDPQAKRLSIGPVDRLAALGLPQTAALLRLLAGPADTLSAAQDRMTLQTAPDQAWSLALNRRYLVWEGGELRAGEAAIARVAFPLDGYRQMGEVPWPMTMVVDRPGEPWKLKLAFEKVQLGTGIPPEQFKLEVPEGTERVESP